MHCPRAHMHVSHPHKQPCSHTATAVQLRGAISAHKRLRCDRVPSFGDLAGQDSAAVLRETDGSDTEAGLELLEDSLIGNDVLLGECKRQSDHLRQIFNKCIRKDRCAMLPAFPCLKSPCSSPPHAQSCSPPLFPLASTTSEITPSKHLNLHALHATAPLVLLSTHASSRESRVC